MCYSTRTGFRLLLAPVVLSLLLLSCHGDDDDRIFLLPPVLPLTAGSPLADTVARGGFNAYAVSVLPGTAYKISMTDVSDDADLLYFGTDSTFTNLAACAVDNTALDGISPEDCVVQAPGSVLYFEVDGTFVSTTAAAYTVAVEQVIRANLNLSVPVVASVGQRQAILYTLPGPVAGPYSAAITGLSDDIDLNVFADSLGTPAVCTVDNTRITESTPEDCRLVSSGSDILLLVDGIFSSSPVARYTVFVNPAPALANPANEGLPADPVPLVIDSLRVGQAGFNGTSFYAVTGLTPGSRYTMSISGLTNGADLTAYGSSSSFTTPVGCLIDNTGFSGQTPESCTVVSAGTELYFTVDADTASGGAAYITLVEPGP